MILSWLDHASEKQISHSREVKARVMGGVELTLGRHLQAGLLKELRICSNSDTLAWGGGVGHRCMEWGISQLLSPRKGVKVLFFLSFFPPRPLIWSHLVLYWAALGTEIYPSWLDGVHPHEVCATLSMGSDKQEGLY